MKRIVVLLILVAVATPLSAQVERQEIGNRVVENIPEVPDAVVERMRQYRSTRSANLQGWKPDGKSLFVLTRFGETKQIHAVDNPMAARRQLTFYDEPVRAAAICPDSTKNVILFLKDIGGDENYQIYYYDIDNATAEIVTPGQARNGAMIWSHTGRRFAYTSTLRNGRDWDIYVTDLDALEKPVLVHRGEGYWEPVAWSHDNRKLLLENYISINKSNYFVLDITNNELLPINPTDDTVAYSGGVFSHDGSAIFFASDYQAPYMKLYRYDLQSGEMRNLTDSLWWDVAEIAISPVGDAIAFTINENGYRTLFLMDGVSGKYRPLPGIPRGYIYDLHFSPNGLQLGFSLNRPNSPTDVYVMRLQDSRLIRWTKSEVGGLDTDNLAVPELISYSTFDSVDGEPRMIPAFYYKPNSGPGPHPVVVYIHGGPESQYTPRFSSRVQYWVNELDIAVIAPNVRGSKGYGKEYLLLDNAFRREESVRDIGKLLDWIAGQDELDASRVGVYGGSYGGYMVLSSLTHYSDRLRCGIDVVGISNFVTFLENTKAYRRDMRRAEYGDERDPAMREHLEIISPTTNAHKITVPLFIAQGLNDPRVPASEAEQILEAVRDNDIPAWYLLFKDEGHGFAKKSNRDYFEQVAVMFWSEFLITPDEEVVN